MTDSAVKRCLLRNRRMSQKMIGGIQKQLFRVLLMIGFVCIFTFGPSSLTRQLNLIWNNGAEKLDGDAARLSDNHLSLYRRQDPFQHQGQLEDLGKLVQNRLRFLQNPMSCSTRRKLKCIVHNCGLGCQVNTAAICFMLGYALNRTVVFEPALTSAIQPVSSTCTSGYGKSSGVWGKDIARFQVVTIKVVTPGGVKYRPKFYPPAIPDDLADSIASLHSNPFLWWAAQITSYIFKPTKATSEFLEEQERRLGFSSPIVGIHIRRTDKLYTNAHAQYRSVDEYMVLAEKWYVEFEKTFPKVPRRVFLATDDPGAKQEINTKYPEYTVLHNDNYSRSAENVQERYTDYGKLGILHDTYMLSRCDFVVCTFSSNICRLTHQLMQTQRGNDTHSLVSLDIDWFLWGGIEPNEKPVLVRAKMPLYGNPAVP